MRCVNFCAPNKGLRGAPVGTCAKALVANGLKPFFKANRPLAVKIPHLYRSRRVISPWDSALMISARFSRARCASLMRARDAVLDRYMSPSAMALRSLLVATSDAVRPWVVVARIGRRARQLRAGHAVMQRQGWLLTSRHMKRGVSALEIQRHRPSSFRHLPWFLTYSRYRLLVRRQQRHRGGGKTSLVAVDRVGGSQSFAGGKAPPYFG